MWKVVAHLLRHLSRPLHHILSVEYGLSYNKHTKPQVINEMKTLKSDFISNNFVLFRKQLLTFLTCSALTQKYCLYFISTMFCYSWFKTWFFILSLQNQKFFHSSEVLMKFQQICCKLRKRNLFCWNLSNSNRKPLVFFFFISFYIF